MKLDDLNEQLREHGLPEIHVDDIFPDGSIVAVKRPLPPGIEADRVRLVEIIDSIDAEAKREIEALPVDLREERSHGIMERAQQRAQEFIMQLVRIEELYRETIISVRLPPVADTIVVDIPATPVTPSKLSFEQFQREYQSQPEEWARCEECGGVEAHRPGCKLNWRNEP